MLGPSSVKVMKRKYRCPGGKEGSISAPLRPGGAGFPGVALSAWKEASKKRKGGRESERNEMENAGSVSGKQNEFGGGERWAGCWQVVGVWLQRLCKPG